MANVQTSREQRRKDRRKARQERAAVPEAGGNSEEAQNGRARKPKSKLREWTDAIVFAVIVTLVVRTFIFDLFRIPTPSMEKNLMVGDYLFVSKLNYGTRTPMTIGIPFTQVYLKGINLPHWRLPGFSHVERGDAIVFNFPAEDKAIDRKTHYIKRVVGLPGETLEIRDKMVYVDGEALPLSPGMQQIWNVYKKDPRVRLSASRLSALGVEEASATRDPYLIQIQATPEAVREMETWPYIDRVEPYVLPDNAAESEHLYPRGSRYTRDNFGPITLPKKDATVALTAENWPAYEPVIREYEGHTTRTLPDGSFEIDGRNATEYAFAQDYFFVMGDNRDNSEDSRFWGFVPMNHVVGKAILIYFSWDADDHLPRFGRLFSFIH